MPGSIWTMSCRTESSAFGRTVMGAEPPMEASQQRRLARAAWRSRMQGTSGARRQSCGSDRQRKIALRTQRRELPTGAAPDGDKAHPSYHPYPSPPALCVDRSETSSRPPQETLVLAPMKACSRLARAGDRDEIPGTVGRETPHEVQPRQPPLPAEPRVTPDVDADVHGLRDDLSRRALGDLLDELAQAVERLPVVVGVQGPRAARVAGVPSLDELERRASLPDLADDDPVGPAAQSIHDREPRRERRLHVVLDAVGARALELRNVLDDEDAILRARDLREQGVHEGGLAPTRVAPLTRMFCFAQHSRCTASFLQDLGVLGR